MTILNRVDNAGTSAGSVHSTSGLDACAHACRPLHHNARALRNVSYMVDDTELPDILANLPPCDGASDEGEPIQSTSPGPTLVNPIVPNVPASEGGLSCERAWNRTSQP